MRYGYERNILFDVNGVGLLRNMRDRFSSIPGWDVWDDQISATSPYIVFRTTTSEGVDNVFYTRIGYHDASCFYLEIWTGWDDIAHVGVGDQSGRGRIEHNGVERQVVSYYWCGDQDHIVFYVNSAVTIHMPTYIGLTTKMQPDIDGPRGVIMPTWYYIDGHIATPTPGYSYADSAKCPVLRGSDGVHDKPSYIFTTYPFFRSYGIDQRMPSGPYNSVMDVDSVRKAMYWYPLILVENPGIGPRGILKSILATGNAYYSNVAIEQKVKIGSRDYVLIRTQPTHSDAWPSRRNPWGQYYGSGGFMQNYIIPTSDYYTPCYIQA